MEIEPILGTIRLIEIIRSYKNTNEVILLIKVHSFIQQVFLHCSSTSDYVPGVALDQSFSALALLLFWVG